MATSRSLAVLIGAASIALLAGCASPAAPTADPTPADEPTTEPVGTDCPTPGSSAYGPAVLVDEVPLLGTPSVPEGMCAYTSESGTSVWVIAQPYDTEFPSRITEWLEPLGWTATPVGLWDDGDLENVSYTGPEDLGIVSAFAHTFEAYPEKVSFNMGAEQEFLDLFGLEPGDELALFAAWQ